jgi:hypothetical protein
MHAIKKGTPMPRVVKYGDQYFQIDISEVTDLSNSDKVGYVGCCSEAFKELRDLPRQACSRIIPGPPLTTLAEALKHAQDWVKLDCDAQQARHATRASKQGDKASVVYTVWLFNRDGSAGFDFGEYADAKAFAKAAERSVSITKVGTTSNESPQYLTVWERP